MSIFDEKKIAESTSIYSNRILVIGLMVLIIGGFLIYYVVSTKHLQQVIEPNGLGLAVKEYLQNRKELNNRTVESMTFFYCKSVKIGKDYFNSPSYGVIVKMKSLPIDLTVGYKQDFNFQYNLVAREKVNPSSEAKVSTEWEIGGVSDLSEKPVPCEL